MTTGSQAPSSKTTDMEAPRPVALITERAVIDMALGETD
jgi:hypothetical protein